jgi:hypothetical protein
MAEGELARALSLVQGNAPALLTDMFIPPFLWSSLA